MGREGEAEERKKVRREEKKEGGKDEKRKGSTLGGRWVES